MNRPDARPRTCRLRALLTATVAAAIFAVTSCSPGGEPTETRSAPEATATDTTTPSAEASPGAVPEAVTNDIITPDASTHFGLSWFSPPSPEYQATVMERWEEASAASSVGRFMTDWTDVEPEEGQRRFDDLEEALIEMAELGQRPMVSIVAVDVSGTDVPEWLGGFEAERAADAYVSMVEEALPILREHEVWMLAIANEPPLAEDDFDRDGFARFVELVVDGLQQVAPELPVTFTFAGGDPFIDDPAIGRMIDAVDVYSVNHYCLDAFLLVTSLDDVAAPIDRHVDRAGDLPIVFQEFGCPASELMGSSDEFQLEWFDAAFAHIAGIDQIRAAFVFEFLDWSLDTYLLDYGEVEGLLVAEVGQDFTDRFRDWVLTSGLVRSDGTTRPAFDRFVEVASR